MIYNKLIININVLMKKYLCVVITSLMLSGCASSKLSMNNSDYEDNASMEDAASMEDESFDLVKVDEVEKIEKEELVNDGTANYLYKQGVKYEEGKGTTVDV